MKALRCWMKLHQPVLVSCEGQVIMGKTVTGISQTGTIVTYRCRRCEAIWKAIRPVRSWKLETVIIRRQRIFKRAKRRVRQRAG